jgi:glycosyltransferase involved in cell wall biosynthesis
MACGVPIATSNVPPMPEICEDAAVYFDPYDPDDIAKKIDSVLSDEALRRTLIRTSHKRCRYFDWETIAGELIKVFNATSCCSINKAGKDL